MKGVVARFGLVGQFIMRVRSTRIPHRSIEATVDPAMAAGHYTPALRWCRSPPSSLWSHSIRGCGLNVRRGGAVTMDYVATILW